MANTNYPPQQHEHYAHKHIITLTSVGRRFYIDCDCNFWKIAWSREGAGRVIVEHRTEKGVYLAGRNKVQRQLRSYQFDRGPAEATLQLN